MQTLSLKFTASLIMCANVPFLLAAATPIGVVVSGAGFMLNNTPSTGNTTVLDESSVQTGVASATIRLNNGGRVTFAAESRGTLSISHRLLLEQGSVQIEEYSVNANNLRIDADHATATISLRGPVVEVAASAGQVHIFNSAGINVANLSQGNALNLQPRLGISSMSSMTGCVTKAGREFLLTDTTSKVAVVLHGEHLKASEAIHVTGNIVAEPRAASDSPKGFTVLAMNVLPGGCKALPLMAATETASAQGPVGVAGAVGAASAAGTTGAVAAGAAASGSAISGTMVAGVAVAAGAATTVGVATAGTSTPLSSGR